MPPTIDVLEACISASISTGSLDDAHNGISLLLEIIEEPLPLLTDCLPRIVRLSLTTTCSNEVELELRNHASQVPLHHLNSLLRRGCRSVTAMRNVHTHHVMPSVLPGQPLETSLTRTEHMHAAENLGVQPKPDHQPRTRVRA